LLEAEQSDFFVTNFFSFFWENKNGENFEFFLQNFYYRNSERKRKEKPPKTALLQGCYQAYKLMTFFYKKKSHDTHCESQETNDTRHFAHGCFIFQNALPDFL
jgi:hypothetical protein